MTNRKLTFELKLKIINEAEKMIVFSFCFSILGGFKKLINVFRSLRNNLSKN